MSDLDKKFNKNDLIYWYKGNTPDVNFDEFGNAFDFIDNIQSGKINLADAKHSQEKCKSYLGEIKKGNKKHRSKLCIIQTLCIILKCFTKQETKLLNLWWLFFNGFWIKN